MELGIQSVARDRGVDLSGIALSPLAWDGLRESIQQLPHPGELRVTYPNNMFDIRTRRPLKGIQFEAGVYGWELNVDEVNGHTTLITPAEWYSAQFRIESAESILPHFLEYNGGASAIQYHWRTERTFMDPSLQKTLPNVDLLERSGTWVKTRYQLGEDGIYRPIKVAVDLEFDSNGLTPQMARDQICNRHRMVFDLNARTYSTANGIDADNRSNSLNVGHTVVQRGRSTDTYRNPNTVHLFVEPCQDGTCFRINPNNSLWQTDLTIPYGIIIPDYPGSLDEVNRESIDYWVDQHRSMI